MTDGRGALARRVIDPIRRLFVLNRGRPVVGRGVRTAFALLVPIILGDVLNQPLFAWAALGGWLGSLADKGGSYRTRALTMGALLVFGSAFSYAGTLAAHSAPIAVLAMLVVAIVGGLGRVYGDEGSTVGLFVAVLFAVAEGSRSPAAHLAQTRAVMLAGGVAWAMALSLVLWPLHPFRPARQAVARCYRELAQLARALEEIANATDETRAGFARDLARSLHANVRASLEEARVVLAGVRRPRSGRSPRGEQLLVLTEGAEQLFGTLIAIESELDAAQESTPVGEGAPFARAFECIARALESVAMAVDDTVDASARGDTTSLPLPENDGNVHLRAAVAQLSRLGRDLEMLTSVAAGIDVRASSVIPETNRPEPVRASRHWFAWLRPMREGLSPRAIPLRHAVRMGIASAGAVWLSYALDDSRGYWATITILLVLQPYSGATVRKTLQRVAGSVGGGILAAALAFALRTKLAIAGVMFPLTIGAVAVLPLNYAVFVFLLTPVFVLLAEPHPGDWTLAGLRVANTVLGGMIALVASQLLWPVRESASYAPQLGALLRELRAQLVAVTGPGNASLAAWRRAADEARRRVGVAVSNAEATLQRLIMEDAPPPQRIEAAMTVLAYSRRMASTLSALAAARASGEPMELGRDGEAIAADIDALASALSASPGRILPHSRAEEQMAASVTGVTESPISLRQAQLERLRTQLAVLQRAVERYHAT